MYYDENNLYNECEILTKEVPYEENIYLFLRSY